jgi:phosphoglycerate dehydrogenase-like enzyme
MLLAQRLEGSGLRLVLVDGTRPLESQVADVVALVPSVARITAPVISAAKNLKAIVQFGAGLDNVDREAAAARGIAVRNVPGANAQAVAELALFLMLALARRLPLHRRSFAARIVGDPPGSELSGKTLGIVGLGASGRQLARMARGIGMEVVAIRRNPASDPDASWVGGPGDLHALLARSDYVSLHIPTSAETRNLMNAAAFRAMKKTASLINVGRGDLLDRAALIDALDTKTIGGAGLDVYWEEPPDPADPLLAREDVVATPHIGGVTEEALNRIATRVAEILKELVGPRPT